jgi:hypothetical protein
LPGSRIPPHPFPGHRAFAFRTVPSGFSPSVPVAQRSNRRLGFSAIGMGKAGRNVGCNSSAQLLRWCQLVLFSVRSRVPSGVTSMCGGESRFTE